jgi:ATP-grasp ribosomal peptide maturase
MTGRSVLVLTRLDDPDADAVITQLHHRDVPAVRFDPGLDYRQCLEISARYDGLGVSGWIRTPTRHLDLAAVQSVYYRRLSPWARPEGLSAEHAQFAADQAQFGLGGVLAALPCRYVSGPSNIARAEYKPAGLAAARLAGFTVPAALITNRLAEAQAFAAQYPGIVYKPLRSPRLSDAHGGPVTVWTQVVDPGQLDDGVAACPHLFQVRVDKVMDVRTTVAGGQAFSARIDSPHLDFRSDYSAARYSVIDTPAPVVVSCRRYLEHFGLMFGAFDFGVDRAGCWHFFECNPNGQWGWIEQETGLPIAAAIARLLDQAES